MSIPIKSRCFHGLLPSRSGAEGHLSIQAALEDRDFMVIFVWLNGYFYGTQWWFLYGNVWDLINGIKCWWFGWTGLAGASWSFWSTLVNLGIRGFVHLINIGFMIECIASVWPYNPPNPRVACGSAAPDMIQLIDGYHKMNMPHIQEQRTTPTNNFASKSLNIVLC